MENNAQNQSMNKCQFIQSCYDGVSDGFKFKSAIIIQECRYSSLNAMIPQLNVNNIQWNQKEFIILVILRLDAMILELKIAITLAQLAFLEMLIPLHHVSTWAVQICYFIIIHGSVYLVIQDD
ncbi:unnamed protein product [Paramecium octaurelia]|uniref:Uncharacterized protein n=1 Tax=Paramecium octaurelia TaxID=43137 RepID=A0A8S1YLA9_PAROT|nr:unnamed protein product [Paramecium octaurelia]